MGLIESSNIDKISRGSRNHAEFFERNAMVAQNFTITMKSRCPSQKGAEKRQVECNMLIRNRAMTQDHNQHMMSFYNLKQKIDINSKKLQ